MSDNDKFVIKRKVVKGLEIESFILELNGKEQKVPVKEAIKLAKSGRILSAEALLDIDNKNYILYVENGTANISSEDTDNNPKLEALGRVINNNNKCIGYKVKDTSGKEYTLSIQKTWELASIGCINGIKAGVTNGIKTLLSTESLRLCDISVINN